MLQSIANYRSYMYMYLQISITPFLALILVLFVTCNRDLLEEVIVAFFIAVEYIPISLASNSDFCLLYIAVT